MAMNTHALSEDYDYLLIITGDLKIAEEINRICIHYSHSTHAVAVEMRKFASKSAIYLPDIVYRLW